LDGAAAWITATAFNGAARVTSRAAYRALELAGVATRSPVTSFTPLASALRRVMGFAPQIHPPSKVSQSAPFFAGAKARENALRYGANAVFSAQSNNSSASSNTWPGLARRRV
jgi:hypothetical protein